MKFLIIDDDKKFAKSLKEKLEVKDDSFIVDYRMTPERGEEMANSNKDYDVIFVDFKFENRPSDTCAKLGISLRKRHPLTSLILMTAWGHDEIRNYIHVGFDNYWPKYDEGKGEDLNTMLEEYDETIVKALSNAQERCKSVFKATELAEMRSYLDAIDEAICFLIEHDAEQLINSYSVSAGVCLLMRKKTLEKKILSDMATPTTRKQTKKKYKLYSYNYLSSDVFELRVKKFGDYTENALKIRQLLLAERNKWEKARGVNAKGRPYYNPIREIVDEFAIATAR